MKRCEGTALIEFVIVFPVLFMMLFGCLEITRMLIIQQRLERSGYVVSDIITRYLPATSGAKAGEINEQQLEDNVFPTFSRVLGFFSKADDQAIIVTSLVKEGSDLKIKWQKASTTDKLVGCDTDTPNTCVESIVNGLAPGGIGSGVLDTTASFPSDMDATLATMPDGENMIVSEVFFYYRPLYKKLLQSMNNSNPGKDFMHNFFLDQRIFVKRSYFVPRNEPLVSLPPSFPAP